MALEVDWASNRNEYQEYFLRGKDGRFVGLTTLPPTTVSLFSVSVLYVLLLDYLYVWCSYVYVLY
jgi:hypothetical protein